MDGRRETPREELHRALHDLCQPLTALQCRLELGLRMGDPPSLREAVDGGLQEAERVCMSVARIRLWLREQDAAASAGRPSTTIQ